MENIKTNYREVENKELNGLELYFDSIPTLEERNILKANGFKWHHVKMCWYKKMANNTQKKETKKESKKDNTLELKAIKKATAEEVEAIAKEQWPNSTRMQDFIIKSYDFYILQDGYYIEIDKVSKLSIYKTMWYDDETERPENNEANFILYNMQMNDPFRTLEDYLKEKKRLQEEGCATGLYDYKGLYITSGRATTRERQVYVQCYYDKRGQEVVRYLTADEMEDYIKIKKDLREKYLERLKRYYSRYSKHVHACGYWVNR